MNSGARPYPASAHSDARQGLQWELYVSRNFIC
jgi:hypothetical protein